MAPGTDTQADTPTPLRTILRRMMRVCTLDKAVYPEIESDPRGVRQAVGVVATVAAAAVIGTVIAHGWHAGAIGGAILAAILHWLLWSVLIQLVATLLFHAPTRMAAVLRGLGYAQAPQVLVILSFIPILGVVAVLVSRGLVMLAGNQAMREALGESRLRVTVASLATFLITFALASAARALLSDIPLIDGLTRP